MVCPKLVHGDCRFTKEVCKQPYNIKMIDFKACAVYKKAAKKHAAKKMSVKKKTIKKKTVHRTVKKKGRKRYRKATVYGKERSNAEYLVVSASPNEIPAKNTLNIVILSVRRYRQNRDTKKNAVKGKSVVTRPAWASILGHNT